MTLIETLDKARKDSRIEARNSKITGDGDSAYYTAKADGIYEAMCIVKEFISENTEYNTEYHHDEIFLERLIGEANDNSN